MRSIKWIAFCFLLVASIVLPSLGVEAQATSTATFIPPTLTSTSIPNDCPQGTPAGWGTYTPSGFWLAECGDCSSISTSTPTIIPTSTGTPLATVTGTPPTATRTLTAMPTPVGGMTCGGNQFATCTVMDGGRRIHYDFNKSCVNCGEYNIIMGINFPSSFYGKQGRVIVTGMDGYTPTSPPNGYAKHSYYRQSGNPGSTNQYPLWDFDLGSGGSLAKDVSFTFGPSATVIVFLINNQKAQWGDTAWDYGTLDLYAPDVYQTPTATPTATGTPFMDNGYCASIAPPSSDFGFDLFIDDGEPNCAMGWGEFAVGDYTIPAVQICLQPVIVGQIRMFGEDYEVGIYFLALGAAFFWSLFRGN